MKKLLLTLSLILILTCSIKAEIVNYKNFTYDKEKNFESMYNRFFVVKRDNLENISYYKITNDLSKQTELTTLLFNINVVESANKKETYIIIASEDNKAPKIYDCIFYIDGKKCPIIFEFLGQEEEKTKTGIIKVSECLLCKNIENLIPNIINAKEVVLRIKTHYKKNTDFTMEKYIDIKLDEQAFYNIQKFYKEHIVN